MASKSFAMKTDTWNELRSIKNSLNEKFNKTIPWDQAFKHILEFYNKGKNGSISSEYDIPTKKGKIEPPSLKAPSMPSIPKMPPNVSMGVSRTISSKATATTDMDLSIPAVPMKKPVKLQINANQLELLKKKDTEDTKFILIECQICGDKPIEMPVPRHYVLEADVPVVDVTYIHSDPEHAVVAQLDHDFQVRRRRASNIVYEKDYK